MSERFVTFAWCENCTKTRDLNQHGRCGTCNSDAVTIRKPKAIPGVSIIEELMELEQMFRMVR